MIAQFSKVLLYCYILFNILITGNAFAANRHPLHVSTTDISYNKQDNKIEVICTVFTDDFETALAKQYHVKTDLTKPDMHKAMDALIKNYLNENVRLKTQKGTLALNYVGYEINREAVNVYFESSATEIPKRIDAQVSILHNLFDDQMNIVHMTVNGVRKSTKLDFPDKTVSQIF
ncbi:hypothetical protein GS399_10990 [Pedobacter sp. HMF7647]|uniref:Peptidase E n=1 Tax=Hufsiella arboris TaxID=2695275 RepID=A0A7K1YA96_9SPHI|nr:DUF6702 family protein [Hufsiella arboris]MXV51496.1 hypothetical protein [Hufsiella arboris]